MGYVKGGKSLTPRTKVHKSLSQKSEEYEGRKSDGSKTFWFSDSVEVFRTSYFGIVGVNDNGFGNYPPNPIAVSYAKDVLFTMRRYGAENGTNNLSSLMYLYNYIKKMADQLARDEKRYLKKKVQDIKNHSKFRGEEDSLDYILPGGEEAFINAIDGKNFSEAFTLLMSNADSYDALIEEIDNVNREVYEKGNVSGTAAKQSDFYHGVDLNYLLNQTEEGQRFLERLSNGFTFTVDEKGDLKLDLTQKISTDALAKKIVELAVKAYNFEPEIERQFEDNKKLTIESLTKAFNKRLKTAKNNNIPRTWKSELEKLKIPREDSTKAKEAMERAIKNKKDLKNLSKKNRKVYSELKKISVASFLNAVFGPKSGFQTGYLGEMAVAAHAQNKADAIYITATTNVVRKSGVTDKENTRVMTTDLIMLDTPFQDLMDETMKDLRKQWLEGNKDTKGAILKQTIDYLKERAKKESKSIRDIFEVKINIKSYRSNQNLKTAYQDTFGTIGGRLGQFASVLKSKASGLDQSTQHREIYSWVHQARSFNNLLWMLNNTFDKGFANNDIQTIANMIAGVSFLWMWEEVGQTFTTFTEDMAQKKGMHTTIYLFNSGTAYFTASQILKQTAEYILEVGKSANPMVDVDIQPTKGITDDFYESLKNKYPVGSDLLEKDPKAQNTPESNMEILRKRWNVLRNKSLKEGKIAISFNQKELDKLLGSLSIINRQN